MVIFAGERGLCQPRVLPRQGRTRQSWFPPGTTWRSTLRPRRGVHRCASACCTLVSALTDRHEIGAPNRGKSATRRCDYIDTLLKAIVGFALPIQRLQGKRKLSQNRSAADIAGVREGLAASFDVRDQTLARFIPKEPL
jgi:transcriptional regulator